MDNGKNKLKLTNLNRLSQDELLAMVRWQASALTAIRDGVLISDARKPDQPLTYVNQSFEQMTGYSSDEITGQNCRFLQGKDTDPEAVAKIRDAIDRKTSCNVTVLNYRANGEPFWNDLRLSPMFDRHGELSHYVAVTNDITARINLIANLEEHKAESNDLFESFDFGFAVVELIFDEKGKAVDWLYLVTNSHFEAQAHLANVKGKRIKEVLPDIEHHWLARFADVVATNEPVRFEEHSPALGDRWFDVHAFRYGDIGPNCVAFAFSDITDRKREQNRVHEAIDRAKLSQAAAVAESRSKSSFLASMSHEVRTPLAAILGFAEILEHTLTDPDDLHATSVIRQNVEYLEAIVADVLDLAKIEAGKLPVKRSETDLQSLISDVSTLMELKAESNNLRFDVEYTSAVPEVIVSDAVKIRQILINLLSNAVKFTRPNFSQAYDIQLRVSFGKTDSQTLTFDVIDHGIGISGAQQEDLFKPFVQLNTDGSDRDEGTGLGLSICRRLASLLGGRMSLISEPGKGSIFSFHLPVDSDASSTLIEPVKRKATLPEMQPATVFPITANVLVVDDRPDIRSFLQWHLETAGATVVAMADGQTALDTITRVQSAANDFDLVIMDMRMPGLDGFDTTRRLRKAGFDKPIIALTASVLPEEQQQCIDAGCNEFLSKPVKQAKLIEVVAGYTLSEASNSDINPPHKSEAQLNPPTGKEVAETRTQVRSALRTAPTESKGLVLILEDDADTRYALTRTLSLDGWSVITASRIEEALLLSSLHQPNVVLTDLNLPDGRAHNLLDMLSQSDIESVPSVIALSGNPVDFETMGQDTFFERLSKPVSRADLLDALQRAMPG